MKQRILTSNLATYYLNWFLHFLLVTLILSDSSLVVCPWFPSNTFLDSVFYQRLLIFLQGNRCWVWLLIDQTIAVEVECNHSKGVQCGFNHLMCCLNVFSWFCSHSAAIVGPIGVIVSEETARCVLICLFYCSSTLSLDSISCNVIGHLFVMLWS